MPSPSAESPNEIDQWWTSLETNPPAVVRDALYDRIPLTTDDLALLATPEYHRLDRIQQLGFVSRIWPGAKHTRFEHSLGVMHLARRALLHLSRQPAGAWITLNDIRTVSAAALLHDIGHYPFSHAIEELGSPIPSHEAVGQRLIASGSLGDALASQNLDPARIAALVYGEEQLLSERDRLLVQILSGTLDVDKLDYLPRDARACHVPYGGVDTARLLASLRITTITEPETDVPGDRIVVGPKGISPLHSLINARQEMFDNVYWHHTNRTCMVMLLRAVQEAILNHAIDPDDLWRMDDVSLLDRLQDASMPPGARTLAGSLARREFHKRAVEVSNRATQLYGRLGNLWFDQNARRTVELQLASALSERLGRPVDDTAVLIDIPKPEKWKTDVWVAWDRPPIGMHHVMRWREVVGLSDNDFKQYEEHRRLVRIVTEPSLREIVAEEWESLLYPLLGGVF